MYAIRSYYESLVPEPGKVLLVHPEIVPDFVQQGRSNLAGKLPGIPEILHHVITSYSIHYTKLYDIARKVGEREILHQGESK